MVHALQCVPSRVSMKSGRNGAIMAMMKMDVGWETIAHPNAPRIVLQSQLFSATVMKRNAGEFGEDLMQMDVRWPRLVFHG